MKSKLMIAALFAFTFLTTGAFAATNKQNANVPFEFHLGDRVMPAGNYTIRQLTAETLEISNDAGSAKSVALTFAAQRTSNETESKLVFRHIGDQYFLVQVWGSNTESGRALVPSRQLQDELKHKGEAPVEMGSK
jgi:hypothetical protein